MRTGHEAHPRDRRGREDQAPPEFTFDEWTTAPRLQGIIGALRKYRAKLVVIEPVPPTLPDDAASIHQAVAEAAAAAAAEPVGKPAH